jgi:excisionase family DNA binding protein
MVKELTTKEAAARLGVSHDTITRWVKQGKIKARRAGVFLVKTSPIVIPESEIVKLEKRLNEQAQR